MILILNTPESAKEGLNTHFEDILLLAVLTVTEFPMCTGSFAKNSFQIDLIIRNSISKAKIRLNFGYTKKITK